MTCYKGNVSGGGIADAWSPDTVVNSVPAVLATDSRTVFDKVDDG